MQSPEASKVGVCPRGPARVADRCCRLCRMNFKCVSLAAGTLIEKNAPPRIPGGQQLESGQSVREMRRKADVLPTSSDHGRRPHRSDPCPLRTF